MLTKDRAVRRTGHDTLRTAAVSWTPTHSEHLGGVVSTTGWIILIVVLLIVFGGFGFSRRGR